MKKLLRAILSLCLIAACIFGLLSVYGGFQDVLNIQDYKTADGDQAKEGIEMARDGLAGASLSGRAHPWSGQKRRDRCCGWFERRLNDACVER